MSHHLVRSLAAADLLALSSSSHKLPSTTPEGSAGSRLTSGLETPRTNSAYMGPPPVSPGRKSTLLAICRQLPPSMQRVEWCLDDYIITDKLYKGYASMGELLALCQAVGVRMLVSSHNNSSCTSMTLLRMLSCTLF